MAALAQRSPTERMWIFGGAVAALVLVLIGWFAFISPQRSDTDEMQSQVDSVHAQNVSLETRISSLAAESKNMSRIRSALDSAQHALPTTSGETDFLRSLQALGARTGTSVVNVTVGVPTALPATAGTTTGATTGSAPSAAAASSSPGPAASGGATAGGAPTASVYTMTITAQVNGSTDALNRFLDQLQRVQPRAVLITQLTEGGAEQSGTSAGGGTSLQLTMQAFVAP